MPSAVDERGSRNSTIGCVWHVSSLGYSVVARGRVGLAAADALHPPLAPAAGRAVRMFGGPIR